MTINAWTGSPDPAQQDAQASAQGEAIVKEFSAWLNERRGMTVALVFHEVVAKFRAAVEQQELSEAFRAELDKVSQRNFELRMEIASLKATPTSPAQQDAQAVDGAIIDVLLPKLYGIVNELLEHEGKPIPKEAKIAARRILPPQFRHSFEHGKTHSTPTPPAQASEMSKVSWGVDWGLSGDRACASIVRRLPDGVIEVLATEIGPQINWLQRVAPIDWSQAGALMEAAASAKSAGFTTGTTNWAAHICRHMEAISARQKPSWARLPADDTEGGAA